MILSALLIGIGIVIIGKYKISPISEESKNQNIEKRIEESDINYENRFSFKAVMFGLIASLGWAIGIVLIDYATNEIDRILQVEEFSSVIGNVIRFPFALLFLSSFIIRENWNQNKQEPLKRQKKTKRTWSWLIIASIIGTSLGAYLYTEATRTAGASLMSLIATACPLFALPISYFLNGEKISKEGFLGVILTIIGVAIILI